MRRTVIHLWLVAGGACALSLSCGSHGGTAGDATSVDAVHDADADITPAEVFGTDQGADLNGDGDTVDLAAVSDTSPTDTTDDGTPVVCGGAVCGPTQICLSFSAAGGPRECSTPGDGGVCPEGTQYTNACGNHPAGGFGCIAVPPTSRCADGPAGCPRDQPNCECAPKDVCQLPTYRCASASGKTLSCLETSQ